MTKILIIIAIILAILLGVGYLVVDKFYNLAINAKAPKDDIFSGEHNQISDGHAEFQLEFDNGTKWLEDNSEIVSVTSNDGLNIKAYVVKQPNPTNKWVITVHGYTQPPLTMGYNAKMFYDKGFNVLAPNLRGHGISDGDYVTMGFTDRLDIINFAKHIANENENAEIVLYGISMGANTVMMASMDRELGASVENPSDTKIDNVKVIVEDCGYNSIYAIFAYQLKQLYGIPAYPLLNMIGAYTTFKTGIDILDAKNNNFKILGKSNIPTLFIHGDEDTFVPFEMLDDVYANTIADKQKLVMTGAGHAESFKTDTKLYWDTVFSFVDKYVK